MEVRQRFEHVSLEPLLTDYSDGILSQWCCDQQLGGCCLAVGSTITCTPSRTVTSAAAAPPKAATPSSHAQSFKNVTVSATDPRITYTPQWNLGSSTCDSSQQYKKTVTTNQSLSFNTQGFSGKCISYPDQSCWNDKNVIVRHQLVLVVQSTLISHRRAPRSKYLSTANPR